MNKTFLVKVKHDKGMSTLRVKARNQMKACLDVMRAEACPMNAIVDVVEQLTVKCPHCHHHVWDTATIDQRLNHCHNCGLRFDSPEGEN